MYKGILVMPSPEGVEAPQVAMLAFDDGVIFYEGEVEGDMFQIVQGSSRWLGLLDHPAVLTVIDEAGCWNYDSVNRLLAGANLDLRVSEI
jgi:hypothetical protein